ncbi:hypothetical protein NSK_003721 [Nannochloropsis salina CCMP1776]|uniref:Calmodulin-lysine N-methyltransferase n=1 Tax=Nannochloropsis salina CCMP1776 TaxID=1027361 RepID=A0A4D9D9J4_9STRA|nr:hypothetical protein NSK_003721 [Nannochloropsis salina CCMP1776]|eukprot:TFJ85298.1 hypothetical protein NSK_003721 [Nannochloropsis salina CCMP1776]
MSLLLSEFRHHRFPDSHTPQRVLEVGAGCSGLAGMGLALLWTDSHDRSQHSPRNFCGGCPSTVNVRAAALTTSLPGPGASSSSSSSSSLPSLPPCPPPSFPPPYTVCLTDGHSACVSSLRRCLERNQARFPPHVSVQAHQLLWTDSLGSPPNLLEGHKPASFDLIVGADVLFFERFHDALLKTLSLYVNPAGGEVWLLQPSRGGSLERFVSRSQEHGGWEASHTNVVGHRHSPDTDALVLLKLRRRQGSP